MNVPQAIVYFDETEDKMVMKYKEIWGISKAETIKRMIREFEKDGN